MTGSYKVDLPDGRRQIVSYRVDPEHGYQAEVTYVGDARYPDQPGYRATPYGPPEPERQQDVVKFKRQTPKKSLKFPIEAPAKVAAEVPRDSDLFAEPSEINYDRPERTIVLEDDLKVEELQSSVHSTAVPSPAVPATDVPSTAVPLIAVPSAPLPSTAVHSTAVPSTAVPFAAVPSDVLEDDEDKEPTPQAEPISLAFSPPVHSVQQTESPREGRILDWRNCNNLDDCITSLDLILEDSPNQDTSHQLFDSNTLEDDYLSRDEEISVNFDIPDPDNIGEIKLEPTLPEADTADLTDSLSIISEIYGIAPEPITTTIKTYSYNPTTEPSPASIYPAPRDSVIFTNHAATQDSTIFAYNPATKAPLIAPINPWSITGLPRFFNIQSLDSNRYTFQPTLVSSPSPYQPNKERQRKRNIVISSTKDGAVASTFNKVLYRSSIRQPTTPHPILVNTFPAVPSPTQRYVAHYGPVLEQVEPVPVRFKNINPYEYPTHVGTDHSQYSHVNLVPVQHPTPGVEITEEAVEDLVLVEGLVPEVGAAPVQKVEAAPEQEVGAAPVQKVGAAPVQEVGAAPVQEVGAAPEPEVGAADTTAKVEEEFNESEYYEDYSVFPFGARLTSAILNINQIQEEQEKQFKSTTRAPLNLSEETLVKHNTEAPSFSPLEENLVVSTEGTNPPEPEPESTTPSRRELTVTPVHRNSKVRLVSRGNKYIPEHIPSY